MNAFKEQLAAYWTYARSPFQSTVIVVPVLLIYELGVFFFNRSDMLGLRNGADVLLRYFFGWFGVYGFYAFAISLLIILLVVLWLEYTREGALELRPRFLGAMLLEGGLYGALLFVLLSRFASLELQRGGSGGISVVQQIILALGAGIYEEFVFRVLIISGVTMLLVSVAQWQRWGAYVVAGLVSALVFSAFHYIGYYGEIFQMRSFLLRGLAGLLLSLMYILRGFGVTVYAHIVYDLIVILFVAQSPVAMCGRVF